eukprot:scaffold3821_cov134-Isochrysis_galbana.AAC.2
MDDGNMNMGVPTPQTTNAHRTGVRDTENGGYAMSPPHPHALLARAQPASPAGTPSHSAAPSDVGMHLS